MAGLQGSIHLKEILIKPYSVESLCKEYKPLIFKGFIHGTTKYWEDCAGPFLSISVVPLITDLKIKVAIKQLE